MDERFYSGMIPAKVRVLGHKFQGLTLWHALLLHALESPLIGASDRPPNAGDLLVLAKINKCSYPNVPCIKPKFTDVYHAARMKSKKHLKIVMSNLRPWLESEFAKPKYYKDITSKSYGSSKTSPRLMALAVTVAKGASMPLEKVWNIRLAEALYLEGTIAEINGGGSKFSWENEEVGGTQTMSQDEVMDLARKSLPPKIYEQFKKHAGRVKINGATA